MGYILPVHQSQYSDYQTRVNENKRLSTKAVEKPFKVVLEKQHQDIRNQYERLNNTVSQSPQELLDEKKGRYFNVTI
ncbi:hypothetical protein [Oceanobacillus salinisoli]|uniref:hypothetical protein n=1 Tax=Oceanobacillus salinisoli TaxID=2678611 RepID=UPI0012E2A975|nr:hypothetical protein [Oceanobacillus salinisoli]